MTSPTQQLAPALDIDARLTEIPFVVGQYTMLSMFANSLGVVLEPDYEPLPVDGVRRR